MLAALLFVAMPAASADQELLVVYPETAEPFRSVFEQIVQGIESQAKIQKFVLSKDNDRDALASQLIEHPPTAIVALGQRSVAAVSSLDNRPFVVAGAILSLPELDTTPTLHITGISMAPDPALLFARLRALAPRVRQVTVLYNPEQNEWLIKRAQAAAEAVGIKLAAYPVANLSEAARGYRDIFTKVQGPSHAIWLPMDGLAAEESTILPLVLEHVWKQNVVLFASNLEHVQRGALFCLYPNHLQLGRRLAELTEKHDASGLAPLRDVRIAVNLHTASHLGLDLSDERSTFDLVLPAN